MTVPAPPGGWPAALDAVRALTGVSAAINAHVLLQWHSRGAIDGLLGEWCLSLPEHLDAKRAVGWTPQALLTRYCGYRIVWHDPRTHPSAMLVLIPKELL